MSKTTGAPNPEDLESHLELLRFLSSTPPERNIPEYASSTEDEEYNYKTIISEPTYDTNPDRAIYKIVRTSEPKKLHKRKKKVYMVSMDLDPHSFYALDWTLESLVRNDDEVQIVSVVLEGFSFSSSFFFSCIKTLTVILI